MLTIWACDFTFINIYTVHLEQLGSELIDVMFTAYVGLTFLTKMLNREKLTLKISMLLKEINMPSGNCEWLASCGWELQRIPVIWLAGNCWGRKAEQN